MSDTCVAPRPVLVPSSRHSAEDGQGQSAADLIARLTGSSAPPPSGGRRARRAAEADEADGAPFSPLGVPAADARPAAPDSAPTALTPPVAPAVREERPAPPAGLTGSFFTSGLGAGRGPGGDGISLTGVFPALSAAIRSPKAVAAAATVTVLGASAVLTGLPTPGGEIAQATGVDSPTVRLAAADATLDGGTDADDRGDDRPTQVLQAVQDGPGAVGGSMQSAFGTAMGALPQVFDKADAARIAAVQKAEAAKAAEAAEEQRSALRRAARSAGGAIDDAVDDVVGQATGAGAKALAAARAKLGTPYQWGASGPNAFDCSGLTSWAFKQAGISIPRTSAAQSTFGTAVSKDQLQPGDLVFFYSPVSHVGIYMGGGKILHASTSGEPVKVSDMSAMPFHNARRI
ncbi:C40 family peptidase [Pseudonocardia halophobica]|uniref:C40 family peptidase n=1 Tax=Pseudonocardia halophobica TaxID=29401 RepID=UPI003D94AE99